MINAVFCAAALFFATTNSNISTRLCPALALAGTDHKELLSKHDQSPLMYPVSLGRIDFLRHVLVASSALQLLASPSNAAPPFAIMAEELGYFPVTDEQTGQTVMVPAKAKRESTDQAIALAKHLQSKKVVMYGTFWCPHCQRQKELFGREAWKYVNYVECSANGYKSQFDTCLDENVDGYPTWKFGHGKIQGGEMELIDIAEKSGFKPFDGSLEGHVPSLGGGGCK
jgi:thiol-disulfide isomerase/thioredoxin